MQATDKCRGAAQRLWMTRSRASPSGRTLVNRTTEVPGDLKFSRPRLPKGLSLVKLTPVNPRTMNKATYLNIFFFLIVKILISKILTIPVYSENRWGRDVYIIICLRTHDIIDPTQLGRWVVPVRCPTSIRLDQFVSVQAAEGSAPLPGQQ